MGSFIRMPKQEALILLLTFVLIFVFSYSIYSLLFFWDNFEAKFGMAVFLGFISSLSFKELIESYLKRIKILENVIYILRVEDEGLIDRIQNSILNNYTPTKDIAFGLVAEKLGCFKGLRPYSGGHPIDNLLANWGASVPDVLVETKRLINDNFKYDSVYSELKKFDEIMKINFPRQMNVRFPKESYFIRLNFLQYLMPCVLRNKFLMLNDKDIEIKELGDFGKHCLNEFYKDRKGYNSQECDYRPEHIMRYCSES